MLNLTGLEIILIFAFLCMSCVGMYFAHLYDKYRMRVEELENDLIR